MEILLTHPYLLGLFILVMTALMLTDKEDEGPISLRSEHSKPKRHR